ncbi:MAG: glycoside hydrolase family 32 protein [Gemmiger sp.]|nr:glycoside hydrolase family 32 protein [Gemmiger sp.]
MQNKFAGHFWRQALHLEPPDGWLNDPNGLCWFGGAWQVYFQYSPATPGGTAPRCWGHFTSPDLLHWRFTGTVLRPDTAWDQNGVYSGSAVAAGDALHLFYTGNVKAPGPHDYIASGRGANVLLVTTPDGHTMGQKQCLLQNADYPAHCTCHVRDPKVWQQGGEWRMLLGARYRPAGAEKSAAGGGDEGRALVYTAPAPGGPWQLAATLAPTAPFGYMWECPDWFTLPGQPGRGVLSLSPQGLPHGQTRFQNVYQAGWFPLGDPVADPAAAAQIDPATFTEWDYGFDFYAPQTMPTPDGRRILIGWMGVPDAESQNPTAALGWQHCLTLPRELFWDNAGHLCQAPARELLALRGPARFLPDGAPATLNAPCELCAQIAPGNNFALTLAGGLTLCYDEQKALCTLHFADAALGGGRTTRRAVLAGCHSLRVMIDRSSMECYLNDGACVFSTRYYPPAGPVCLQLRGAAATLYALTGMEVLYEA